MARTALFAYGSLVDPVSAALTLGRGVEEVWAARLPGHRRRFSQARDNRSCEKTFARVDDGSIPPFVLGLNLEPAGDVDDPPNGTLIEVSETELERLDVRELRYDRTPLDPARVEADTAPAFDRLFTYVAKPAHRAPEPPPGAVILASYATTVEAAFAALGESERALYLETTLPYPVEVIEAELVADQIPEGNPRAW
jgi:cation transport regulator ChaC